MTKRIKRHNGLALVAVMVMTVIFTVLGLSILSMSRTEVILADRTVEEKKAFYAAEAGIEYGIAQLNKILSEKRQIIDFADEGDLVEYYDIQTPQIQGYSFDVFSIEKVGNLQTKIIDTGPQNGMESIVQQFKITVEVSDNKSGGVNKRLVQWVEDQRFHLYQFATFYEQDLEINPGPTMTIAGRIHSNSDIYLNTNSELHIDSYVTSSEDIYRESKPGDPQNRNGDVWIKDKDDVYHPMDIDSSTDGWIDLALETWQGTVRSKEHDVPKLKVPIPLEENPIEIIKRGDTLNPAISSEEISLKKGRLYWQAGLRIIDGVAYNKAGQIINLDNADDDDGDDDDDDDNNPINTDTLFFNHRENKQIKITEIDVQQLVANGKFPANGIIYISSDTAQAGQQDAVRIVNADTLPAGGMTIATDNPLYIQGDFNLNKRPASVLCDSINILSNQWVDPDPMNPIPTWNQTEDIEINTCIIAGHSPTEDGTGYGGGLENLMRFVEDWSGETITWRGSINSLWYSEQATGLWIYGEPFYKAPNRDWGFDQSLLDIANLPPGTPIITRSWRANWYQEDPENPDNGGQGGQGGQGQLPDDDQGGQQGGGGLGGGGQSGGI